MTRSRIRVVPLGVSDAFRPAADAAAGRRPAAPIILHVGDLHPRRNVRVLIDAVAWLRAHHPELASLTLTLLGRDAGEAATLRARARAAGLDTHAVTFVDDADDASLIEWYRRAAVFAYPSRYEGFGLPVLEAMASGVPVVASNAAALPEVVGDAGLLVDPLDTRAWCEALAAVLCSPARAAALREAGVRRAARFSWTKTAALTLDAYRAAQATQATQATQAGTGSLFRARQT
jgi:glycosyltransferase involved in cell wall biosynthesis